MTNQMLLTGPARVTGLRPRAAEKFMEWATLTISEFKKEACHLLQSFSLALTKALSLVERLDNLQISALGQDLWIVGA